MIEINHLRFVICSVILLISCVSFDALADGEQYEGGGTRWVDPVVFFKLQDINSTDFKRDYDKGDIDINRVIREKGVKIYGMRLKPIAAAGMVPKYMDVFAFTEHGEKVSCTFNYYNVMGVEGIALHEAGFCVYTDEVVNRSYNIEYIYNRDFYGGKGAYSCDSRNTANSTYIINSLRIVPHDGGIAFSYSFKASEKMYIVTTCRDEVDTYDTFEYILSKPDGVNEKLGHFIYFSGDSHLLVMLSTNAEDQIRRIGMYLLESDKNKLRCPWSRVYFEVEEIQVDAAVAAAAEGEDLNPGEDPAPGLDEQDKEELRDFVKDVISWLKGEGDPLGLGEHAGAKESAAINAIAAVAAALLGSGITGFVSGTGAQIASNLTNTIIGGGGAELPLPQSTRQEPAIEPKRPEEEENSNEPSPEPEDDGKFHPTDYPEYCKQYITQLPDGDLRMKDPVTGRDISFFKNEEGKWQNYNSGVTYTDQQLEENLRYRVENRNNLRQDADTAERNSREQREQWDAMNKRDRERGYSDEMKDYRDWKKEQERLQKKEEYLEKLADKYHTTIDKLPQEVSWVQAIAEEEHFYQQEIAKHWDTALGMAEKIDKYSEAAVNVMGECIPGGKVVKNVYTFTKATMVAVSEAVAKGMPIEEGIAHVAVGMGQGALGVLQNQAGSLTKNPTFAKEFAITIGTEGLKEGMKTYAKTGDLEKTLKAMSNAVGKKTADFYTGKLFSKGVKFVKDSAKQSLTSGIVNINDDTGLRFGDKTASFIDKWMGSGDVDISKTSGMKGWNITDANGNFSFTGTSNVSFGGQMDIGNLFEAAGPEALNLADAHDWAGNLGEGTFNLGKDIGHEMRDIYERAQRVKFRGRSGMRVAFSGS